MKRRGITALRRAARANLRMAPPTWRTLAARARRMEVAITHGPHEAVVMSQRGEVARFASWVSRTADSIILRTAVAAALEQLERR